MAAPLVPSDVDLRGFDWFPLFRRRLLASRFHRLANDAEWRAGFILWVKSWDEVPAGSLPSDDRELCAMADIARDMRHWKRIKAMALHGWELCDDGRLYHPVVAEVTLDAAARKAAHRKRTEAARAARQRGDEWRVWYIEYLNSDAWKAKRQEVLDRCNGICERCHKAPVRDVHHLTYKHVGNEPLDELLGLCKTCHELAHQRPA